MADEPTADFEEEVVEDQPQPSQAPEQEPEQQQEETPQEEPGSQEEEPEEERPVSRREQLRVADLLNKYGPPTANRPAPSQRGPDFRERVIAEEDVYKDLENTTREYGQEQYQAGQSQAEYSTWRRFLQMDENSIRGKYDVLNPSNGEAYHGVLEKALQQKYLRFVGFDAGDPQRGVAPTVAYPDVSYADFVESEMEFSDELASMKVSTTTKNIARQAANTSLRPDGSRAKRMDLSKSPEDMTDEELQAAIGASMPRDAKGRFSPRTT